MPLMLFAGIPVRDHAAAVTWYERFFGRRASFQASNTESVWELAEHRSVAAEEHAEHGIPSKTRETYDNGVRKVTCGDLDGNEIGYGGAPLPS